MEKSSYNEPSAGNKLHLGNHLYQVLNDSEFRNEAIALNKKYRRQIMEGWQAGVNRPKTLSNSYSKKAADAWKALTDKYLIREVYILLFLDGTYSGEDRPVGGYMDEVENDDPCMTLNLSLNVTYREYIGLWKEVQRNKPEANKRKRKRGGENPKLVYAIFKARNQKKLTFREIFELYSNGQLSNFKGSSSQFKSEDSLESYYRKYRPH